MGPTLHPPRPIAVVHHQLRVHGSDGQHSPSRRCIAGDDPLRRRETRLHPLRPRPLHQPQHHLPRMVACHKLAADVANKADRPWVLDPFAVGASGFRLRACLELVEKKPTVIG
ncbi:hypothetical protein Tsubulata_018614 [Turnera subulata]|uniref:hydroxyethylthiazole kinase n=1 Tax=Turnera subulata TaxID=218843 RepID=A0A9Q0IW16_9ROSI|nr:hypothetical protein Tsubulata_018614 [Turnera subulata]